MEWKKMERLIAGPKDMTLEHDPWRSFVCASGHRDEQGLLIGLSRHNGGRVILSLCSGDIVVRRHWGDKQVPSTKLQSHTRKGNITMKTTKTKTHVLK